MPSGIYEAYMEKLLEETYVLPIHSNPTRRDSDADGLNDMNDKYDSVTMDERYAKLSPLKINTIETLYPELQLYDSNINNNRQNAVYFDINGNVIVEEIDSQYPGRESYVTFNVDNMDYVENKFTELLSEYCSYGIPHTQNVVIHWSPDSVGVAVGGATTVGKINMYKGYKAKYDYDEMEYKHTVAHEFGGFFNRTMAKLCKNTPKSNFACHTFETKL